jgi:hypothetical protein
MTQETNQQHAIRSRSGQGRVYESILDTMGNTPVVKVNRLAPAHVSMFVKAEYFNPGGSVKDRLAINIIEQAEQDGRLKPGQTVVEATSGNTGIGLAMVCAAKGYPLVIVMAESFSIERRKLIKADGALRGASTRAFPSGYTSTAATPGRARTRTPDGNRGHHPGKHDCKHMAWRSAAQSRRTSCYVPPPPYPAAHSQLLSQ